MAEGRIGRIRAHLVNPATLGVTLMGRDCWRTKPFLITWFLLAFFLFWSVTASAETIRFWAVSGSIQDIDLYRSLAREFSQSTGIQVEVTPLPWGNFQTKYFTSMAAGMPPDIGLTNLGGPFDYGSVGGVVDLRAEFPEACAELEKRFDPKILPIFTIGKRLYGVPSDLSTLCIYCRTDIFDQLGLTPPKTWSELNHVIDDLEANGYRYYFGFTAGNQWAIDLYTLPYGLPSISATSDGAHVNWTNPNYQKGVMEAMRLWNMHDSPGKDLQSRAVGLFRSNDKSVATPMFFDQHAVFSQITHDAPELKGKWAIIPWPRADDGVAHDVMGGTSFVIFRQSKHKEAAMKWLTYLCSDHAQETLVVGRARRAEDAGMAIPGTRTLWAAQNRGFWDQPELSSQAELVKVLRETVPTFASTASAPGNADVGRLESNVLDQMATWIRDLYDQAAQAHGISRTQLFQELGSGKLPELKADLEAKVAKQLAKLYGEAAPKADQLLASERERYNVQFGRILGDLPAYERAPNILTYVEWFVVLLSVLAICAVATSKRLRPHALSYAFVGVPILLALVFVFVPAAVALYLSFTEYHPVLPLSTAHWVGMQNFVDVASSGDLMASLGRTFYYALATLPIGIVLSLVFAYLLNQKLRANRFWRFLYFSPMVTSVVSVALIFTQLFLGGSEGWLNALLLKLRLTKDPIPFLTSEHSFLNCVVTLAIWQGLAFTILVFLAGLQQIPDQLYEAAELDGAGFARRFWRIAIPGLRPQLFFVTVLGVIGSFQVFETIYTLAGKSGDAGARFGPNDSGLTMVPLIYHHGFETFEMGKSAAIAYVLFAVVLAITFIQLKFSQSRGAA